MKLELAPVCGWTVISKIFLTSRRGLCLLLTGDRYRLGIHMGEGIDFFFSMTTSASWHVTFNGVLMKFCLLGFELFDERERERLRGV